MTSVKFNRAWEIEVFDSFECGALVAETTEKVRQHVVNEAPRRKGTKTNWTAIKKNVSAHVERDSRGWYGNVTIELNDRVRHTLLQDRGWTDRGGRKHPGLHFIKEALLKSRVE